MSKNLLSKRLDGVSESATLKLNTAVQSMKAKGIDVVNLAAGEPDFSPPREALEAVIEAVKNNKSKYTPAAGIPELKNLIANKTNNQQPLISRKWTPSEVVVSNGGKQALFNAFLALINEGDEVIIPSPFWVSYPEMVKLAGGVPVLVQTTFAESFKLTPERLRNAIKSLNNPKLIVLTSPNNPTGSLYSKEEYQKIGEVLESMPEAKNILVVSDEIYDRIILGNTPFSSFLGACPRLQDRVVTVNGLSKSAAMTGWRIGWTVANLEITQAIITIQGQSTSGVNALSQSAAIAALKISEAEFNWQIEKYKFRRDLALETLKEADKLKIFIPEGAFYIFVGIENYLKIEEDSMSFSEDLLDKQKVAVVPGLPFGQKDYIRISFATDDQSIVNGCKKIVDFLKSRL